MAFTREERAAQARAAERAERARARAREQALLRARVERRAQNNFEAARAREQALLSARVERRAQHRLEAKKEEREAATLQRVRQEAVKRERLARPAKTADARRTSLPPLSRGSEAGRSVDKRTPPSAPRGLSQRKRPAVTRLAAAPPILRPPVRISRPPSRTFKDVTRAMRRAPMPTTSRKSQLQRAPRLESQPARRQRLPGGNPRKPARPREMWRARPPTAAEEADRRQAEREGLREAARQTRLEQMRSAEARQRSLDQRMQDLASQRRAERLAARRGTSRGVPTGSLSGSLPWLHADGPHLLDETDRPVTLRGATATWLEHPAPLGHAYPPALNDLDLAMLQAWGANAVAVPFAQDTLILGSDYASPSAYLEALDGTIARAAEAGMYTILRLSVLSSEPPRRGEEPVPDRFDPALPDLQSLAAWGLLARRYANESAVLFDLFRSPHDTRPDDATRPLVVNVGWTLWRRWLLALLGEVRRQHPRALVFARGIARGRDLTGFPLRYTDGTIPSNVVYAAELTARDAPDEPVGLAGLARDHPVGVMSWWAGADDAEAVQAQGRRFARRGWHWLAAGWNDPAMPLVQPRAGTLRATALGRAFRFALAQPQAPSAHADLALLRARGGPPLPRPDPRTAGARPGPPRRDPFAPPGSAGNRWVRFGDDGPIPPSYRGRVNDALDLIYALALQPAFVAVFASVVSRLTGKTLGPDAYLDTLDRLILNMADTARDPRIVAELARDAEALKMDRSYQRPPAYSVPNQPNVWILEFQLAQPARVIAGSILHEATHVAGAPADFLSEVAIDAIHHAAGLPRQ